MPDLLAQVVHSNAKILRGTPVFKGTRVPVRILFEFLAAGDCLAEFLDAYPSVSRPHAVTVIKAAEQIVMGGARSS